jgi:hypothetical protein
MTKKALISPLEEVLDVNTNQIIGIRIVDIAVVPFEVAYPFYWIDCADDTIADQFYYSIETSEILKVPVLIPSSPAPVV